MPQEDRTSAGSAAAAVLAFVSVAPAVMLFTAAVLRLLQPVQHEPAATANAVVRFFGALSRPSLGAIVVLGPLFAFFVAVMDQRGRWKNDSPWRTDIEALGQACGRVLRRPFAVLSAIALLSSVLILAFIIGHAIAG